MLLIGARSPCARSGDIAVPIASPATKTITVSIPRSHPSGGSEDPPLRLLFFWDDVEVLVVLVAHVLEEFGVRAQDERQHHVPRLRAGARIIDRDDDLRVAEVLARKLLD